MAFTWQQNGVGQFPMLTQVDLEDLRKKLQEALGRDDVRIKSHHMDNKDDHILIGLSIEVR